MYLHENREEFGKMVKAVSAEYNLPISTVEKDYYVTMILKLLAEKSGNCVFKGGTSLSKGFRILKRFSEDVDITFNEHLGEKRRKKLKHNIIKSISEELHLPITNWDMTQSDRDYNCYIFSYEPLDDSSSESLFPGVRLETAMGSYAFPVEIREIGSYIGQFLRDCGEGLETKYGLRPFKMQLQSIERTYIDKVFALCDYFLQGKAKRYSRHMYDIFVLTPYIAFDENFRELVAEVRNHRAQMKICPSAKGETDISGLIRQICATGFYKSDYEKVTSFFVESPVAYENAAAQLLALADSEIFRI